jgi:hypothetical protein
VIDLNNICDNCILPNGFLGIILNENGVCNFCEKPDHVNMNWSKVKITGDMRKRHLENWSHLIKEKQQKDNDQQYDCIIGYSGGKDSTALLDLLINEYGLSPLAVTVDTGFMTEVAEQNIRDTLFKMNFNKNHLFIKDASKTFIKLYKWHFLNHNSHKKSLIGNICDNCSDLIHSIIVKESIKRNIDLVLFGYSPDQIKRYFYKIPKKEALNDWQPNLDTNGSFNKEDLKWFIDPLEISIEEIPQIILPYHVLKYDEEKIKKRVESKGLIRKGKTDPILTNCHVVKAALMYDLYRYGGLTYALQYAELIRQEEDIKLRKKIRKNWLRIYKNTAKSILSGTFAKEGINKFFNTVGISKDELLELIRKQRDYDPNKNLIIDNLELIRNGRFK